MDIADSLLCIIDEKMSDIVLKDKDGGLWLLQRIGTLQYRPSRRMSCDSLSSICRRYILIDKYQDIFCAFTDAGSLYICRMYMKDNDGVYSICMLGIFHIEKKDGTYLSKGRCFSLTGCIDAFGQYVPCMSKNVPVLSRLAMLGFFGGPILFMDGGSSFMCDFHGDFDAFNDARELFSSPGFDKSYFGMYCPSLTDSISAPVGVEKESSLLSEEDKNTCMEGGFDFCILDCHDGIPVFRFFLHVYVPDEKGKFHMVQSHEYMRLISDDLPDMPCCLLRVPVIWISEKACSYFKWLPQAGSPMSDFALILCHPVLEEVYKFNHGMFMRFSECAMQYLVRDSLQNIYGAVKDKGSLPQKLGVPKCILKKYPSMVIWPRGIRLLKDMFADRMDYFQCMDDKTASEILSYMDNIYPFGAQNIRILSCMYRNKKIIGFIRYMSGFDYGEQALLYLYYSELYDCGNGMWTVFPWEVLPEHVPYLVQTLKDFTFLKDGFDKMQESWSHYLYHDDRYVILFPKSPVDLINEGTCLRHCAASFVSACAEGDAIILFIRKVDNPGKPFYTIEIRDGRIRQCYGFANANIYEGGDSIELFLKRFCEDRGVLYGYSDLPYEG